MAIVGRAITIEREIKKRNYNKYKKIKCDNFTRSNREKSNIAIAILGKIIIIR